MRGAGVLAAVAAVAVAVAAGAAAQPALTVVPFDAVLARVADTEVDVAIPPDAAAPAKIVVYVPSGYSLALGAPPGMKVGTVDAFAAAGAEVELTGDIVAADPAASAAPQAQACAPGAHAAVWVLQLGTPARAFNVPIYVDPASGADAAFGAYKLQVCFASPYVPEAQGGAPLGARVLEAELDFPSAFTNPSASATYVWYAFATPYLLGTSTPNPAATYEMRSNVPLPMRISLKGRYDRKHKAAVLSGSFSAPIPTQGIPISLYSTSPTKRLVDSTTKRGGTFTFRRKIARATRFLVTSSGIRECIPPTTAPAGCTSETLAPAFSKVVLVRPRR